VRRILAVFGLVLALAVPALGQPAPDEAPPPPASSREPGKPEYMNTKTSGFGLPNVPARGGAYRYRLMGIGAGVLAITAFFTVRYLRRINRTRAPQ